MTDPNMNAVVDRVLAYTASIEMERDCWERAPAMNGVFAWDDDSATAAITAWLDRAVETQTGEGNLSYCEPLSLASGHVAKFTTAPSLCSAFGFPLLELHERTGEGRYLDAAKRQAESLLASPRTKDGGFWARLDGPELWIDFTYMMCPFLARLGLVTGESKYTDEAVDQLEIHARHLVDPLTNLGRHAWCEKPNSYPQSTLWSRGNGWFLSASVDLLSLRANDDDRAKRIGEQVRRTLAAMAAHQDACGFMPHVLDDPTSKFESSGTLMFAYAVARAQELGLVDSELTDAAVRAVRVVAGSVDSDGAVQGVAVPPGGPGVPFGVAPFGQGFFLLACDALREPLGLRTRA